jgi:hypothetical protein
MACGARAVLRAEDSLLLFSQHVEHGRVGRDRLTGHGDYTETRLVLFRCDFKAALGAREIA